MPKNVKTLFCVLLLLSFITISVWSDLASPLEVMNSPFSPVPVSASEEQNVDSFNVHPTNRWYEYNSGPASTTVSNSVFYAYGDGTPDKEYYIKRGLRSLDDKIEIRFKLNVSTTSTTDDESLAVIMGNSYNFVLYVTNCSNDGWFTTSLRYNSRTAFELKTLTGTERIHNDTWYDFTLDYDWFKSEYEWKLEFAPNGTDVWEYDYYDVGDELPKAFAIESIDLIIRTRIKTDALISYTMLDWVDAPFKERDWDHFDESADSDWLSSSHLGHYVQDDIDDTDGYRLVVPSFDKVSVEMEISINDDTVTAANDNGAYFFRLYTVGYDDGAMTEAIEVRLVLSAGIAGQCAGSIGYELDSSLTAYMAPPSTNVEFVLVKFDIHISEDRSKLILRLQGNVNDRDISDELLIVREVELSDVDADYSTEFVLETLAEADFDGNALYMRFTMGELSVLERSVFEGIIIGWAIRELLNSPVGLFFGEMLAIVFRFVAGINAEGFLNIAQEIINLVPYLSDIISAVQDIAGGIWELFETAIEGIQSLTDDIWGVIETLVADMWTWFVENATTVLDVVLVWVLDSLSDIVGAFAILIFWAYDYFWQDVLGFSESPDLLALTYHLGTGFIDVVNGTVVFITDFATFLFRFFPTYAPHIGVIAFLIIPAIAGGGDIGEFIYYMLHNMGFDLSFGLSPVHIPAGIVWIIVMYGGILSGTTFAGFF